MPDSNPVLAGVAHLRNEFLPVLELRALMDVEAHQGALERQLLVVNGTHGPWGVLVDRVMGLESLEISNNQDLPEADDWTSAVIGAAALHDEVTRVLNPRILYRLAENVLQQSWANSDNDRLAV
jgi:chemotaxis signal transduction protein